MRAFLLHFVFLLFAFYSADAQSPGGIAAGNTMWLRSDVGLTSNSNTVSQWQEISGANITGNFTVQSLTGTITTQTGPTVINAGINFNPYVRFDGFTNSLSSINLFQGSLLVTNSNVTVFQVMNLKGGIVWLKWETDQIGSIGRLGFENAGGTIRFDFPKAVPASAGQNIGITNVLNKHTLSTAYADAALSVNRLNGATDNTLAIPGPGDFTNATDKLVIGNENLINLPAQVDMAEVIIYNTTLTAAERNKVESYLAVKYGFTLDQAAANANNYTAANGTVTWDRTANSGYANNITGIGREDASGLSQKQSKSINTAGLITIYNGSYASGNFPALNTDNTNNFSNDASYLIIGDNAAPATVDQCIFNGKGQRMQRIWKASKTGVALPATFSVDQAAVPASVKNIIVSPDPAFPANNTLIYPLTISNGKLYAGVSLNHNDYFTYATDTLVINMVATDPLCSNPNSGNVTTTVSGGSGPFTYSWSPSAQATADLVNVSGGTYTLTVTQGSCQATQQVILGSPASPASPSAGAVSVCSGNTATLTVQNPDVNFTYNWYAASTGGTALATGISFTTPAINANTTYYLEAVSGSCVSIRTAVAVTLTNVVAPMVNAVTICSGTNAELDILNPVATYTYNWYAAATGGTILGSGINFTSPVLTNAATYYVESLNMGCKSVRTAVTVSITTIPAPSFTAAAVCPGHPAILSVVNPLAGLTYHWYNTLTGGISTHTGITDTIPAVTTAVAYYVDATDGVCTSVRATVNITLLPPLDTPRVTASNISTGSITFSWPAVNGATAYQVSVDGGSYTSPSSGAAGLTHTVSGLIHSQTVTISVIALAPPQGCGDSDPGHAAATTYGLGFFVPSGFTPGGNTGHTLLIPILPGGATMEYFTVFNRWGQKVFSTNLIGAGWDGKLQGKNQPVGTFVWICRYRAGGNGRVIDEKGTFTLIR